METGVVKEEKVEPVEKSKLERVWLDKKRTVPKGKGGLVIVFCPGAAKPVTSSVFPGTSASDGSPFVYHRGAHGEMKKTGKL